MSARRHLGSLLQYGNFHLESLSPAFSGVGLLGHPDLPASFGNTHSLDPLDFYLPEPGDDLISLGAFFRDVFPFYDPYPDVRY